MCAHSPNESNGDSNSKPRPGLRPTRLPVPRPSPWRRPTEPDVVSDRFDTLVHELAGLVDGSIRQIGLALRSVDEGVAVRRETDDVANRLKTVQHALERMADAIRTASGGPPMQWVQQSFNASLADAVQYAVGIMQPIAEEHRVRIEMALDERFRQLPPGHLYTVIVNAIRNGIEAIIAAGGTGRGGREGVIRVEGWVRRRKDDAEWIHIEVSDTGVGPPSLPRGKSHVVFEPDFSTKPGGLGIGLAISEQIVKGLGGVIELRKNVKGTGGATLAIEYPVSASSSSSAA